ncbi:hypothetical protein Tco_0528409 [Tanacetum coccineum]
MGDASGGRGQASGGLGKESGALGEASGGRARGRGGRGRGRGVTTMLVDKEEEIRKNMEHEYMEQILIKEEEKRIAAEKTIQEEFNEEAKQGRKRKVAEPSAAEPPYRIYHKNRGRSERIFNQKMKNTGAQVEMQGGLIRDHTVRLEELSSALFERYDRDIGELFTRENQDLRLQLAEERRARLELAEVINDKGGIPGVGLCGLVNGDASDAFFDSKDLSLIVGGGGDMGRMFLFSILFRRESERLEMDNPNITMEEYIRLQEEKALSRGEMFNWQTATYGKMEYCEDKDDCFTNFETKFPAIVLDNTLTSDAALSCGPMVSPLNDNEIDFRISFDESDDEDFTVIYDENSFSYKIISINNLKTDYENDNDKVNMPSFPSLEPKVSYFNDLDFFKDFENEFPAIVYNDALTSKSDLLIEPTISPRRI